MQNQKYGINEVKSNGRAICKGVSGLLSENPAERKTSGGICQGNLHPGAGYAAAFPLYHQREMQGLRERLSGVKVKLQYEYGKIKPAGH